MKKVKEKITSKKLFEQILSTVFTDKNNIDKTFAELSNYQIQFNQSHIIGGFMNLMALENLNQDSFKHIFSSTLDLLYPVFNKKTNKDKLTLVFGNVFTHPLNSAKDKYKGHIITSFQLLKKYFPDIDKASYLRDNYYKNSFRHTLQSLGFVSNLPSNYIHLPEYQNLIKNSCENCSNFTMLFLLEDCYGGQLKSIENSIPLLEEYFNKYPKEVIKDIRSLKQVCENLDIPFVSQNPRINSLLSYYALNETLPQNKTYKKSTKI